MGTHCQMAKQSGRGERQHLGRSTPFEVKKKGGGHLQIKNIIGALAYNLCLYSLHSVRYMVFYI